MSQSVLKAFSSRAKNLHEQFIHHSAKDSQAHYFKATKHNKVEKRRSKRSMEVSFSKRQPDTSNAAGSESANGDDLAVLKALLDCLNLKHEEEMEKAQETTGLLQTENMLITEKTAKIPLSVDTDTLAFA